MVVEERGEVRCLLFEETITFHRLSSLHVTHRAPQLTTFDFYNISKYRLVFYAYFLLPDDQMFNKWYELENKLS